MEYNGKSERVRVRILPGSHPWREYAGQECNAILYEPGTNPQIDTEQLKPPWPRWQSIKREFIEVIG